jgi:integrase
MLYIHASQRNRTEGRKTTKTRQNRRILVDSATLSDLLDIQAHSAGPYLFGGEEPLAPTTIDRIFRSATKKAGLPRIRIHDLRHSHATWLINNGVNIVAVSKRLGHASIEQILKTYTHLLNDSNEQLMAKIDEEHRKVAQKLPG